MTFWIDLNRFTVEVKSLVKLSVALEEIPLKLKSLLMSLVHS